MNTLRRSLAVLLCVLMPLTLTGMTPAIGVVYTETSDAADIVETPEADDTDEIADTADTVEASEADDTDDITDTAETVETSETDDTDEIADTADTVEASETDGTDETAEIAEMAEIEGIALEREVSLHAGGGLVSAPSVKLTSEGTLPELPVPTRVGWNFVGWYTAEVTENYWGDAEGETLEGLQEAKPEWSVEECKLKTFTWIIESKGTRVEEGQTLGEDVRTLYAMYEPTTVTVVWHFNGWKNETGIILTGHPQYGSPITTVELESSSVLNWEGRTIDGWFDAPEGGNEWEFHKINDYRISDKTLTGNLDLYVHWSGGPEAETLQLSPLSQHVEPGAKSQVYASYGPSGVNKPKLTWESSNPELVTVEASEDSLIANISVSESADVINSNKQVTITARTEQGGVEATATVTISHSWNSGKTIKMSTCTEGGLVRYTCTQCGRTKDVVHDPDGHRFTVRTTPATCTAAGYTEKVCVVCGRIESHTEQSALGHKWQTTTVASCSGTVTTKICSTCSLTEVSSDVNAAVHDWENTPTIDKKPTCAEEGSQSYHCRNCDLTKDSSVLPADPFLHEWGDWKVTKEITDEENGVETRVCTVCGATENREIADFGNDKTVDVKPLPGSVANTDASEKIIEAAVRNLMASNPYLAAVVSGKAVTVEIEYSIVSAPEHESKFKNLFGGNLQYRDINIVVKANDVPIGNVTVTDSVLTFSFDRPNVKDGRIIRVLREHDGDVEFLPCRIEGDKVYFSTDKFSTFAVGCTNDISYASVDEISSQTYSGSEIKPAVKVTINGSETLVEGVDYSLSYKNNVNVGEASAVITGMGDFAGSTKEVTFHIEDSSDDTGTNENDNNGKDNGTGVNSIAYNADAVIYQSPKTKDATNIGLLIMMMVLFGGLDVVLMRKKAER